MVITIGANGKKIAYGIKHYNLDTEADLQELPAKKEQMGTTAFVIETSKYYMVNSDSRWVEIQPFGSSKGSTPEDNEIIYEGGVI